MKKAFHNITSVAVAFLVLFSTTSYTVEKHFCGNFLVDKAIFSEAETCGMEMHDHTGAHGSSSEASEEKDFCCENQKTIVEGQDELVTSIKSLDFDQQVFLSTFTYSYINLFRNAPEHIVPFKNYSPPLLVRDVQLLDQVFLI